jgi:hypothetical protein
MDIQSICQTLEKHRSLSVQEVPPDVQNQANEIASQLTNTRFPSYELKRNWLSCQWRSQPSLLKFFVIDCFENYLASATSAKVGPLYARNLVDSLLACCDVSPDLQEVLHWEALVRNDSLIPIWPQTEQIAEDRLLCRDIPEFNPAAREELLTDSLQKYRALGWLVAAFYRHPLSKYDLAWAMRWLGYANSAPISLTERAYLPTLVGFLRVSSKPLSSQYPRQFMDAVEYLRSSLLPQLRGRYGVLETYQPCLIELEGLLNDEISDPFDH